MPVSLACLLAASVSAAVRWTVGEPLQVGDSEATRDLKVGLWAWPMVTDFDGDGVKDLLVGNPDQPNRCLWFFRGNSDGVFDRGIVVDGSLRWNAVGQEVGGRFVVSSPEGAWWDFKETLFATNREFQAYVVETIPDYRTAPPMTKNGCRGRCERIVDLDGDGRPDRLVSYDAAECRKTVWRKSLSGEGAATEYDSEMPLVDANGVEIPEGRARRAMAADFDGDGDADLVVVNGGDGFAYFENVGGRGNPQFDWRGVLKASGRPIAMDLCMITPSLVDYDGDGFVDIVCGDEDGRVAWIRNAGRLEDRVPVFEWPRYFRQKADRLAFGVLATPAAYDWDGDGDQDLICGNSAGQLGFIENLSGKGALRPKWAEPQLLKAGGKVIRVQAGKMGSIQGPTEAKWGYTVPTVADWDGDGLPDLVVNSIWGYVEWYRNVGTRADPQLAPAEPVEVAWEGKPPELSFGWNKPRGNGLMTQWRTTPCALDWTGDGLVDLVMLDTEGYLALYERARRDGELVLLPPKRVFYYQSDGNPIRLNAKTEGQSGRRKFCFCDVDGDGKLDLIVNAWNVDVIRQVHEADGRWYFAAPERMAERRLAGHSTCPTATDFDGDGKEEILLGAEDGFFYPLEKTADPVDRVNPFVGTSYKGNGHTYPAATVPFGFVQAGPDTGTMDWEHCSGYAYEDSHIYGFSQNHLNGTGCPSLGDILVQPFVGEVENGDYRGVKDFATEVASPGYYAVSLTNFGVWAEMTATPHVAWYRFTCPTGQVLRLLIDLQWGIVKPSAASLTNHIVRCESSLSEDGTILKGWFLHKAWLEREVHFVLRFSRPATKRRMLEKGPCEKGDRYILDFEEKTEGPLVVQVALSSVDDRGAMNNLMAEAGGFDFDATRKAARSAWRDILMRAEIRGASPEQEATYYTALYHAYLQPNDMADVDGRFRDARGHVQTARRGKHYTSLSIWDTFRACHPLYSLLNESKVPDFVETLLAQYRALGYLPVMSYFGKDPQSMIANHAVSIVADACLKGFRGFDLEEAFRAVDATLSVQHKGKRKQDWKLLDQYGYYPCDKVKSESVSRLLESSFDFWCAAKLADHLGKADRAEFYRRRALLVTNVFDRTTGFFRARDAKGDWTVPFDPCRLGHGKIRPNPYTEGNAWQYSWHLLQDSGLLMDLMGGREAFVAKLNALFTTRSASVSAESDTLFRDVTGLIGQYAHGNEPSHHVAYLYACAGCPERTAERVAEICRRFYGPGCDGLCGNDDCGQTSAWYLFACYGFYPVNPCGGEFVLGLPQVREAELHFENGKALRISVRGELTKDGRICSVSLNGRPLDGVVRYADIMAGGELTFVCW